MAAPAPMPKKNNTLIIVLLVAFMAIGGLVAVGVLALVMRQPAIIGKVLGRATAAKVEEQRPLAVDKGPSPAAAAIPEPPAAPSDPPPAEEPPAEEAPVEAAPVEEPPVAEPEPTPEPEPAPKPDEAKPVENKPVEKMPAEKKPADSSAGLNSGPRKYYIHTGKCLTPSEARALQADLNSRWGEYGLKKDAEKGLTFSFWKLGPREGADPKSFNNEDFCYEIRTGAITQGQAKRLQEKLKALGHAAGIGKEA